MKKIMILFILCFLVIGIVGCSNDKSSNSNVDPDRAQSLAEEGFQMLSQSMLQMLNQWMPDTKKNKDIEFPNSPEELLPYANYQKIKNKFDTSLDLDDQCGLAHFGMGITENFGLIYNNDLWDMFTQLKILGGDPISACLSTMTNLPLYLIQMAQLPTKGDLSFARLQMIIKNTVLPTFDISFAHFEQAIKKNITAIIRLDENQFFEMDNGEIYLLEATTHAVAAIMRSITAYDMDLYDENNSYDWMQNMPQPYIYEYEYQNLVAAIDYNFEDQNLVLNLLEDDATETQKTVLHYLAYNMKNRDAFMNYNKGFQPSVIRGELQSMIDALQNSITYIENEVDDQTNDIITAETLDEIVQEYMAEGFSLDPTITTINGLLEWLESKLNGEIIEIPFNESSTLKLNISVLFGSGFDNLKVFLPYHGWTNEETWITETILPETVESIGGTYNFYLYNYPEDPEFKSISNVKNVILRKTDREIADVIVEFYDSPNGTVIGEYDMPYFPDYTFHGLFPEMTRELFIELLGTE